MLVICEILGLLVNTLTGDDEYSLRNGEYLLQSNEMQLYTKQIPFS